MRKALYAVGYFPAGLLLYLGSHAIHQAFLGKLHKVYCSSEKLDLLLLATWRALIRLTVTRRVPRTASLEFYETRAVIVKYR